MFQGRERWRYGTRQDPYPYTDFPENPGVLRLGATNNNNKKKKKKNQNQNQIPLDRKLQGVDCKRQLSREH